MQKLCALVLVLIVSGCAHAAETFIPKLGTEWIAVDINDIKVKNTDWDVRVWRNTKNGSLLTIAKDPINRSLDSVADLDRTMDFATSDYREWISERDFPTWRSKDFDYAPSEEE